MAWKEYNPNPALRNVGDCSVRAVAKALDIEWDKAYALIATKGFALSDMPSSNSVWGAVLHDNGFHREVVSNDCPDCYTLENFADDHPNGIYVVCTGTHVACVVNGIIWDSWDSSREIVQFYWTNVKEE